MKFLLSLLHLSNLPGRAQIGVEAARFGLDGGEHAATLTKREIGEEFNTRNEFNARYHYNVVDNRLGQHVDTDIDDGLYISCVASSANLWALIMDAGREFSSQVYDLSHVFLHKYSRNHMRCLNLSLEVIMILPIHLKCDISWLLMLLQKSRKIYLMIIYIHDCPDTQAKITGMLLEMDIAKLLVLMEPPESLSAKVEGAFQLLKNSRAKVLE
ncbi:hypothetical protein RYX36_032937 [Vicia faba]